MVLHNEKIKAEVTDTKSGETAVNGKIMELEISEVQNETNGNTLVKDNLRQKT